MAGKKKAAPAAVNEHDDFDLDFEAPTTVADTDEDFDLPDDDDDTPDQGGADDDDSDIEDDDESDDEPLSDVPDPDDDELASIESGDETAGEADIEDRDTGVEETTLDDLESGEGVTGLVIGDTTLEYADPSYDAVLINAEDLIIPDEQELTEEPHKSLIAALAKSIKSVGRCLQPPVIGTDRVVVFGRKRAFAMRYILKMKQIPVRMAFDAEGHAIASDTASALLQTVIENTNRAEMTTLERGRAWLQLIDSGVCESVLQLSKMVGYNKAFVNRATRLAAGPEVLVKAVENGEISADNAIRIQDRCKNNADIEQALRETLTAATERKSAAKGNAKKSKPSRADVDKSTKTDPNRVRAGRKPTRMPVDPEAVNSVQSGMSLVVRRVDDERFVEVFITLDAPGDDLANFDLAKEIQLAVKKVNIKQAAKGLEESRQRLEG